MSFLSFRKPADLHNDPAFSYMVGRLFGHAEALVRHMEVYGDEKEQQLAEMTKPVLEFFYDESPGKGVEPRAQ